MFKTSANLRSGPNILRQSTYSEPTVIEPEDFTQQQSSTSTKPSSVLIEEVD